MTKSKASKLLTLYLAAVGCIYMAYGFADSIFTNYFIEVFDATAAMRGFIEFPRELPGILSIFIIAIFSKFGDIKLAIIAQILCVLGISYMGLASPSFYLMSVVIFFYSTGVHLMIPLQDSIAMSILPQDELGSSMGKVKGVTTFFTLSASLLVYFGFKSGVLNFDGEIITSFMIAAFFFTLALIAFIILLKTAKNANRPVTKTKLIVRSKYKFYYILQVMNGVQKQIFLVYAPWLIAELLLKGADTISMLLIIGSICGMFFLPFIGRCIDKYGLRKMLYADALSYIIVYLLFAYFTYNIYVGNFSITGFAVIAVYCIYILDRMSSQMGIIRTVYLNSITEDKSELLPTMTLGMALDHAVAIIAAYFSGLIWVNFGPHYIFILAASFSLVNLVVARIVPLNEAS